MSGEFDFLESALQQAECVNLLKSTADFGSGPVICACGPFELQDLLSVDGGGFSKKTMATLVIRASNLPAGIKFHSLQEVTVVKAGKKRCCKIESFKDLGNAWEFIVNDINQNA